MNRREFITVLAGATASWPLAARAQQGGRISRIGVLMARAESDPTFRSLLQSFRTRLSQLGWKEGDNLQIDYRWTAGIAEQLGLTIPATMLGRADEVIE
jgi:putative ABC transport system substrate-binding protein